MTARSHTRSRKLAIVRAREREAHRRRKHAKANTKLRHEPDLVPKLPPRPWERYQ